MLVNRCRHFFFCTKVLHQRPLSSPYPFKVSGPNGFVHQRNPLAPWFLKSSAGARFLSAVSRLVGDPRPAYGSSTWRKKAIDGREAWAAAFWLEQRFSRVDEGNHGLSQWLLLVVQVPMARESGLPGEAVSSRSRLAASVWQLLFICWV